MLYLLDADSLITSNNVYYPLSRFPSLWQWLIWNGEQGNIKIPIEQFEEITAGNDDLVDWIKGTEVKSALLLDEEADPLEVNEITTKGYGDLDETGIETVGRDPFLISYAGKDKSQRCVVTFETPSKKQGKNRKIPDVCSDLDVNCCTLFEVINALDFTTNWIAESS